MNESIKDMEKTNSAIKITFLNFPFSYPKETHFKTIHTNIVTLVKKALTKRLICNPTSRQLTKKKSKLMNVIFVTKDLYKRIV